MGITFRAYISCVHKYLGSSFTFTRCLDAWVVFAVADVSLFISFWKSSTSISSYWHSPRSFFPFCALFPLLLLFVYFIHFRRSFPLSILVTTLLSTFPPFFFLSPDWFPSHSFNGLLFSTSALTFEHVVYMHSLTHWKPLASVGKQTYCRSSFHVQNIQSFFEYFIPFDYSICVPVITPNCTCEYIFWSEKKFPSKPDNQHFESLDRANWTDWYQTVVSVCN